MQTNWQALATLHSKVANRPILQLFEADGRAQAFSSKADGLLFDYSKTNIDQPIKDA